MTNQLVSLFTIFILSIGDTPREVVYHKTTSIARSQSSWACLRRVDNTSSPLVRNFIRCSSCLPCFEVNVCGIRIENYVLKSSKILIFLFCPMFSSRDTLVHRHGDTVRYINRDANTETKIWQQHPDLSSSPTSNGFLKKKKTLSSAVLYNTHERSLIAHTHRQAGRQTYQSVHKQATQNIWQNNSRKNCT